jgi:hypothetical protein
MVSNFGITTFCGVGEGTEDGVGAAIVVDICASMAGARSTPKTEATKTMCNPAERILFSFSCLPSQVKVFTDAATFP